MDNASHRRSRAKLEEVKQLVTISPNWMRRLGYYGLALLFVAVAVMLRWELREVLSPAPTLVFYLAWVGAAAFGGLGPGLLATMASWLCIDFLFDPTPGQIGFTDPMSIARLLVLLAGGLIVSVVGEKMRRTRIRERRQMHELADLTQLTNLGQLLIRDLQDRIVLWSDGCARLYGFTAEQALGRVSHELLQTEFPQPLEAIRATLHKTGRWEGELTHRRADGTVVHVASLWVLRNGTDHPVVLEVNNDITDRKRAEHALHERMKELACLYAVSRDMQEDLPLEELCRRAVAHLVPAMQFPEVTVAAMELKGKRFTSGNYAEGLSHGLQAAIQVEGAVLGHVRVYYTEERPFLIPEEQNLVSGVAEALRTWLVRRHAEESLREVRERAVGLARFPEENPNPVLRVSAEGTVLYRNPAPAEVTGWTCETGGLLREPFLSLVRRAMTEGREVRQDVELGEAAYLVWAVPFPSEHYAHLYGRDITERKQAEANQALLTDILRILNRGGDLHPLIAEVLRLIREASGFDAVGLRLRQGEDCPYFEVNGFSPEFVHEENFLCARGADAAVIRDEAGRPVLECTCGLVLSQRTDPSMSCFTEGGSFWSNTASELLALAPQDDPRTNPRNRCIHTGYESVGLFPVRSGQEVIGLLQLNDRRPGRFRPEQIAFYENTAQNIGLALQRTVAEAALRELNATLESKVSQRTAELRHRARQLQKLTLDMSVAEERERERLAEILHDDLQQVLAAAKFHVGLMRNRARHDASLQATAVQVDHMLKEAIDKSRSLSHELSPAVMHHADFAETLRWLANEVQAKHGLVVHVHAHGPVRSQSDALKALLFRAVQELLFNVVKHARVHEARIRVRRLGRCLCLSVSDHGRGFDPQALGETTGYGLLSIRERIELLGGRMTIKSAKGQGSTLRIVVPEGEPVVAPPPFEVKTLQPGAAGPHAEGRLRVLLADDHEIVREGLISLLSEDHAVEVVGEAANGREAIDLAGRLEPDVVIMDVSMPLIEGDEATRQIKEHLPKTRVIALSMYDEAEKVETMYRAGAESYVLKTASTEELLAAIRGKERDS